VAAAAVDGGSVALSAGPGAAAIGAVEATGVGVGVAAGVGELT
jgi:hypothetical protein